MQCCHGALRGFLQIVFNRSKTAIIRQKSDKWRIIVHTPTYLNCFIFRNIIREQRDDLFISLGVNSLPNKIMSRSPNAETTLVSLTKFKIWKFISLMSGGQRLRLLILPGMSVVVCSNPVLDMFSTKKGF